MILALPNVKQKGDYDCGVAFALCVLRFFRMGRKREDVSDCLGTSPIDGTDPRALEGFFRREGLKVLSGEMTLEDLKYSVKQYRPVGCLVTKDGTGHYVVSAGLYMNKVHYMDPAIGGTVTCLQEDFLSGWKDVDRMGAVYHCFGLAVWR